MHQTSQDKDFYSWTVDENQVVFRNIYQVSKKLQ